MSFISASMSGMWRGYVRLLEKYPWRTQAANTCVLMGGGDFIAQAMVERKNASQYERARTVRFLGVGFCIFGPTMHLWYSNLDRAFRGTHSRSILTKVAMDQCLFLPVYLGAFICIMAVLRKESGKEIKQKLKRDYAPMLKTSYGLWPAVQLVNFYLIPATHRVLVINFVGLFWNTYISWRAEHQGEE